jgi:hypothetical protein
MALGVGAKGRRPKICNLKTCSNVALGATVMRGKIVANL